MRLRQYEHGVTLSPRRLANVEEHQIREVLSGRLHPGMPQEVPLLFSDCFARMQKQKLYDNERRHFRKEWVFETALQCYDQHLSGDSRKLVTRPVLSAVEGVLRTLDPDPDGGYLKTEKVTGVAVETWVPCVMLPAHLVELLKYAFKYSGLQCKNQLGRTALHEACFANRADSHFDVIRMLVDEHVQNLHAVDDHGSDARHLVLDPRGRPDSPTGHRFREDIIDDKRDDILDDYAMAVRAIDAAKSAKRQKEALEDACKRGTELTHEHWSLLKDMSLVKRSLRGVDEFEDCDSQNRFYRWRDLSAEALRLDDEEDAGVAYSTEDAIKNQELTLRYSFRPPQPFVFEEQVLEAIAYVRKRTDLMREVGDWQTLVDSRHADECLLYVSDFVNDSGGIGVTSLVPAQLSWDALQARALKTGLLGAAEEWQTWELEGRDFYVKPSTGDKRWIRPVDAVEKSEAINNCTNITFDFKATSQPWFTCEECNSRLQAEGRKIRLMLCVHCAKRCHDGHRGIKYLRTSKVACMCADCCDCVLERELEEMARIDGIVPLNKLARYEAAEVQRRVQLGVHVPAVLARLPERDIKEKKQGYFGAQVEGWCLARRAEFTEPVDGWQILVDPQQPKEVTVGKTVLVDRIDLVGCKVSAKVVDRWVHKDKTHRFTVMFNDGERRFKVPRDELIVQEHKYFYWNSVTAQTCWEPPVEDRKVLWEMFRGRKKRRQAAEAEAKRLDELEKERLRRLGRGEDVIDLKLIMSDRSLDTGGDVLTLALPEDQLVVQEEALVPHIQEEEAEDPRKLFNEWFRPHFNELSTEHMVWPPLSGEDWGRLVKEDSRVLRYLGDWEEFEHTHTQCRFWRDTVQEEREVAVRKLQLMFRQYWFIPAPPSSEWRSTAYTFTMPSDVEDQERQRTGWALLRRRGKLLREVTDEDRRVWQEYMDPVCGEMFYYLAHSGFSQWPRPKIPHQSTERVLEPFHLEEAVVFRFPGCVKPEHAKIIRVRKDFDTGERMYDVEPEDERQRMKTPVAKWAPRKNLSRISKTAAEMALDTEEKAWRFQLQRARKAKERSEVRDAAKKRARELARADELNERSGERKRDGDLEACRLRRAQAEAQVLADEKKAADDKAHLAAIMASADAAGMDAVAFRAQQDGISLLEAEKLIDEEEKENDGPSKGEEFALAIADAKQRMAFEKTLRADAVALKGRDEAAREAFLSRREDAVTSPRTKARRKLLRLLYKATRRQNQGYVICEWGCGQWCVIGREKTFHGKENCVKRIMPCLLGCGARMRDEQWTEIPDEEMSYEEPRTRQQIHEQDICIKRLVPCDRRCGEFIAYDKLEHHMRVLCIKRPFPPIRCRLGCGEQFAGGAHEILKCEEDRLEHEQEMCVRPRGNNVTSMASCGTPSSPSEKKRGGRLWVDFRSSQVRDAHGEVPRQGLRGDLQSHGPAAASPTPHAAGRHRSALRPRRVRIQVRHQTAQSATVGRRRRVRAFEGPTGRRRRRRRLRRSVAERVSGRNA